MPFNGDEISIETSNVVIHGKQWGKKGGVPVLALHGWLDNAGSFDYLAPLLDNIHLIAIELPGHGQSGHYPPGFQYHLIDAVQSVMDVVYHLKWSQFTFLGHSLGGIIGTLLAASFPNLLQKLILIDAIGPLSEEASQAPARLGNAVNAMLVEQEKKIKVYPDLEAAIAVRQKSGNLSHQAAAALTRRGMAKVSDGYVWRFDRKLLAPSKSYFTEAQAQAFLSGIKTPTVLIKPKQGMLAKVKADAFKQRQTLIKKLNIIEVPGGHHTHMEHPADVAAVINQEL